MIPADSFYFPNDQFEPFVDSVKRAQETYDLLWWIGLYDVDDVEICHNDIIKTFDTFVHHVTQIRGTYGYYSDRHAENFVVLSRNAHLRWECAKSKHVKVIGNTYENPEMTQAGHL